MNNQKGEGNLGIIKFFSELYMLKRNKRSGLAILDAPPDSIAEHIALTAQIAYVLAKMEGLNAEKCATMALFHDNDETRIGDLHKIATLYFKKEQASLRAIGDQLSDLPKDIKEAILRLVEIENSPEGEILHDADWLELAFQAKIFEERGYKPSREWIEFIGTILRTESAKKILAEVLTMDDFTNCWWEKERRKIIEETK